jgi:molecular chaperone GrpE
VTTDRRPGEGPGGPAGAPAETAGPPGPKAPSEERAGAQTEDPGEKGEERKMAADIESARAEAAEYLDHLRRLQAEFDNYRKRILKEQTQAIEFASEPVFRRLLEVLDEFELALMHAQDKPDFERFLHGVELVYAKLLDTLKAEGLEKIAAEGQRFDPERHEALMQTGEGDGEPVVADVLRPGYTLRGRVLRPAGVRVKRR